MAGRNTPYRVSFFCPNCPVFDALLVHLVVHGISGQADFSVYGLVLGALRTCRSDRAAPIRPVLCPYCGRSGFFSASLAICCGVSTSVFTKVRLGCALRKSSNRRRTCRDKPSHRQDSKKLKSNPSNQIRLKNPVTAAPLYFQDIRSTGSDSSQSQRRVQLMSNFFCVC